jgi:NADPH-dependent 2,4-dienoyl-CoA reductase/sulfur reductase-like enzyme
VVVNERFESAAAGIYAAGDVARFFDPLYGRRRRIEHWSNANDQGTLVGRLLAGEDAACDRVSSFFTEVFGVTLNVFGDVSRFDEVRSDGSLADRALVVTYGSAGRLAAAVTVGRSKDFDNRLKRLIKERAPIQAVHDEEELPAGTVS